MKRILSLTFSVIFILLCGCNNISPGIVAVTEGLSFIAKVDYNNEIYEFKVEITQKNKMIMQVLSPKRIENFVFEFSGDSVAFGLGDLKHKSQIDALPEISPASFIYSVFSDAAKHKTDIALKNNEYFIIGTAEKYEYKLFIGTSGLPIKITDSENNITAIIKQATINKG